MSRLIHINTSDLTPIGAAVIVLVMAVVWFIAFCATILLSGIGVYILWLLGRFLIG
jgi:hypothetical protein